MNPLTELDRLITEGADDELLTAYFMNETLEQNRTRLSRNLRLNCQNINRIFGQIRTDTYPLAEGL